MLLASAKKSGQVTKTHWLRAWNGFLAIIGRRLLPISCSCLHSYAREWVEIKTSLGFLAILIQFEINDVQIGENDKDR